MKRFLVLLVLAFFAAGAVVTAEEAVLIDFSEMTADYKPDQQPAQNKATMIDYSEVAGTSFTKEEKALMKTSLAIANWDVRLNSSSRTVLNQSASLTKEAKVSEGAENLGGQTVMGIRVHFPVEPYNAYATVQPPFEIPAYMDVVDLQSDGTMVTPPEEKGKGKKFDNKGVVKNVGVLKSVAVQVRGLNFPHGLSVILRDQNGEDKQIFIGYLNFDGWKTLVWENPNYITEVRNREIQRFPLYPKSTPMEKIVGFVINKDAAQEGGDFITYVKDVKLIYDKAVLNLEREIDDEALWNIVSKREELRRKVELGKLGSTQVLRYLERQKMHQDASAQ